MFVACAVTRRTRDLATMRLIGAGIAGVGIAVLMQQVIPAPPV